jgi:Domain of unknown function (DUF4189)
MNTCRNSVPAAPDGWVVVAFSEPDFAAAVAHGFTSGEAATVEAMTACRRNGGADCKVLWSGVNTCIALTESINRRPWIRAIGEGGSRSEAVRDGLLRCRRAGGDNCLVRNTPCSHDNNLFPSPFEPASDVAIVDPRTVGTWELPVGKGRWVWTIDRRGTYAFRDETSGASHSGSFASNGKVWAIRISTGPSDSGPYSFRNADTMTATGVLGTADWHRVQ